MKKILKFAGIICMIIAVVTIQSCTKKPTAPEDPVMVSVSNTSVTHKEEVILTGTGFSTTVAENVLKLDNIPVTVTGASPTQITFKIPENITIGAKKLTLSVSSLTAASSLDIKVYGWEKVSDHPRGTFFDIASFAIENNIYFCDARSSSGDSYVKEVWKFNLTDHTWTRMADFPGPMTRYSVTCFAINGKGYLGLGDAPSPANCKDFWEFDPVQNKWAQLQDFPGDKRVAQCSFVINGKGFVGTGFGTGDATIKGDFYSFTPGTNTWQKVADYPGAKTYSASAFSVNGKGYVVGGSNNSSSLKELWQYDDVSNSWTQKANFPGEATANMLAFALNSTAYCGLGALGANETGTNSMWSFNSSDNSWKSIAPFSGETRKSYVKGTVGKYGYYGFGSQSKEYSDLWIYAPADYIP